MGFGVFSDFAVTAGIGSLPDPISDEAADLWFVHQTFIIGVMAGGANGNQRGSVFQFDSKAMRKVEEGSSIGVIMVNAHVAHGLQFILKFRMLIKLH